MCLYANIPTVRDITVMCDIANELTHMVCGTKEDKIMVISSLKILPHRNKIGGDALPT